MATFSYRLDILSYNKDVGFIENLRRQRASEAARVQAEAERTKAENDASAARKRAESEASMEKDRRKWSAVSRVSGLARELADAAGGRYHSDPGPGRAEIVLDSSSKYVTSSWDGDTYEHSKTFIGIQGSEDGSVKIGGSRLSAQDANDPAKVEQALERAYRSPQHTKHKEKTSHRDRGY